MICSLLMLSLSAFVIGAVAIPVYESEVLDHPHISNVISNEYNDLYLTIDSYNTLGYSYSFDAGDYVYCDVSIGGLFLGAHDDVTGLYYIHDGVGTDVTGVPATALANHSVFYDYNWEVAFFYYSIDGTFSIVPLYKPFNYSDGTNQYFVSTLEFYLNIETNNNSYQFNVENFSTGFDANSYCSFTKDTWYSFTEQFPFGDNVDFDDLDTQSWFVYNVDYGSAQDLVEFTYKFRYVGNLLPDYYSLGYNAGYSDGFRAGANSDTSTAYNQGYNVGYTEGQNYGYTLGYNDGLNTAQGGTFTNLFGAIADTPLLFLRSLFNFDLFGMNVFVVVMSLVTGILVLYLVKKFLR